MSRDKYTIWAGLLLTVLFSGCGGGGGGAGGGAETNSLGSPYPAEGVAPAEAPDAPFAPENSEAVSDDLAAQATSDLVVSETFILNATLPLGINIQIPSLLGERAYINICHELPGGALNYGNCLLTAPLRDGSLEISMPIGNEVETLGLEIWRYDVTDSALQSRWQRAGGMVWEVFE